MPKTILKTFLEDVEKDYDQHFGNKALEKKITDDPDLDENQKILAKELFGIKSDLRKSKCAVEVSGEVAGVPGTVEYGETWGP